MSLEEFALFLGFAGLVDREGVTVHVVARFLDIGVTGAVLCVEAIGRFGMRAREGELEAGEFAVGTIVLIEFLERILLEVDASVFVAGARDFEGDLRGWLESGCARFGGRGLSGC